MECQGGRAIYGGAIYGVPNTLTFGTITRTISLAVLILDPCPPVRVTRGRAGLAFIFNSLDTRYKRTDGHGVFPLGGRGPLSRVYRLGV